MGKMIVERSFDFALSITKMSDHFAHSIAGDVVVKVVRSGTSVGANVEEVQAGYTKDDFTYKMNTALKEARETHYWLRLARASGMLTADHVDEIIAEADEIKRMLGAIVTTSRKVNDR